MAKSCSFVVPMHSRHSVLGERYVKYFEKSKYNNRNLKLWVLQGYLIFLHLIGWSGGELGDQKRREDDLLYVHILKNVLYVISF